MRVLEPATPWVYRALDLAEAPWSHGANVRLARALSWLARASSEADWIAALDLALQHDGETASALGFLERRLPPPVIPTGRPADWTAPEVAALVDASTATLDAFLRHVEVRRSAFLPRVPSATEAGGLEVRAFAAATLFGATTRTGDLRYANAGLKIVDALRWAAPSAMLRSIADAGPALSLATALACQESSLRIAEGR